VSITLVKTSIFQHLRSLVIIATNHQRNITELSVTECSFDGLFEQGTIDGDTESDVETTVREQTRELVDRVHVLVERYLTKTIEGRTLSGATGLLNDGIVKALVLGVICCDHGRREGRVL